MENIELMLSIENLKDTVEALKQANEYLKSKIKDYSDIIIEMANLRYENKRLTSENQRLHQKNIDLMYELIEKPKGKDYTKYVIEVNGEKTRPLSKSKMTAVVFGYLIRSGVDIKDYATNQFKRKFLSTYGNINTEVPEDLRKKFNKVTADGKDYFIPSGWDKESIDRLIEHIENNTNIKIVEQ